ncbi:Dihydrofolate reductase [Pandoravirus macleodensis]|uniref:Dihydrofolate reductase n=1 Tax=Pandoravirus macleodensis TaxID=2107707 RepID=A0A2U7UFN1_9VIRU|nr:Dihydrofolate reductase [Pandoravirus macleodensis]AVK77298.1 Dihydrofolate reductase [Pandoravirus macleodensis]
MSQPSADITDASIIQVCLFANVDADGWIGYNNRLPPEFMDKGQSDRLREIAHDKTVIVGRKAFMSTFGGRPPGRHVIVMTRCTDQQKCVEMWGGGVTYAHSPFDALSKCCTLDAVVIGGARTFWSFLPCASEVRVCALPGCVHRPVPLRSVSAAQWAEVVPESAIVEQCDGFRVLTWFIDKPTYEPADEPSKPFWEKPKWTVDIAADDVSGAHNQTRESGGSH